MNRYRPTRLTRIALCVAFMTIGAQLAFLSFPPFSLQTFCIFIIGVMLTPLDAFLAMLVYVALGLLGVPIFAYFRGGIGMLFGVEGGYILSFIAIAPYVSLLTRKFRSTLFTHIFTFATATLITYIFEALWVDTLGYFDGSFKQMLRVYVLPFMFFDPLKIVGAAFCTIKLKRIFKHGKKKNRYHQTQQH